MSQNFLERCNEKMQSIYDYCGTKAKQLYAELLAAVRSLYNHCEVKAREFYAMLLEKVQLLYNGCLEKIAAIVAQVKAVIAVAKIQLAMFDRRVRLHVMSIVNKLQAKQQEIVGRMKARYHALRSTWRRNQHFTFWFIPADGQNIAKTHVKKTHLKYAMTAVASFLVFVSCTIGVLAHFAVQNEQQKQELAAYKQTKSEQEQTIRQLRLMAETNQKKLAALSKLEDQVRSQMEKSGAQLPPKSNASDYAGQGGPVLGSANPANIVLEQEKNIGLEADAKKVDLENLLSAIEAENYRREVTPSQWPTSGGYISSSFGGRANPFGGYGRDWHPGIDIATDYGEPVYASAAGYVQQAGWYGGYGIYARINHDYGYQTAYGHMSRVVCRAGQYVKKGEIIGYVGSTGYSTGPHLHFEVIHYGEQVDPSSLM
ncbi:peptidase, M23 family [Phascolarctobacterium succinatutens YIT 12067]|uniref:Peptidase, M23 family n=1 Tax=Phascolarctobacterium succinatutens YIT 12067 TaxID=626939 RepID=E8LGV1_9FIRM|nr:M23 family metallopeptidase [Phascolarctobacterium succinatutens]EFY03962.1 peptidase, M23 family [Phascolarctobacterium succinatutens YIT 12067]